MNKLCFLFTKTAEPLTIKVLDGHEVYLENWQLNLELIICVSLFCVSLDKVTPTAKPWSLLTKGHAINEKGHAKHWMLSLQLSSICRPLLTHLPNHREIRKKPLI